jgi:hypothetical protein
MVARLSALTTGNPLTPGRFLVLLYFSIDNEHNIFITTSDVYILSIHQLVVELGSTDEAGGIL